MMKLTRFFQHSRNSFGKSSNFGDGLGLHSLKLSAGISTSAQSFSSQGRTFAPYSIYKGKAVLSVSPILPTFSKLDSGYFRIDKRGVVLLTFAPAIGERKYDFQKRQVFALSPTEVGSIINMGPKESCEFFHDPSMASSNAGQVRKSLSVKPPPDGIGYFIQLNVANNILKTTERLTIHVTPGEFAVLKTACSFALPHIMGWDRVIAQLPGFVTEKPSAIDHRVPELEWEK